MEYAIMPLTIFLNGTNQKEILSRVKKIHAQSCLNKREKDKYKESNKVLYHFPD
jgi:hypothetical protein